MNRYIDTRGNVSDALSFCEAIVEGIAPGGGLFVPQQIPSMSVEEICALAELPYAQRAARVYRAFEVDVAYSVKYASTFYGPFREAANSAPSFGDRKAYQMDPANTNEALIEAELDVLEGADILMVKPALSYLDVIRRVKDNYNLPLAAYNVSGEYAMLKSAVKNGILSEGAIYESILSIKRAGADIIITYFAKDLAKMIRDNK